MHLLLESTIIEQKRKLVALVHFNKDELELKLKDAQLEISKYFDKKANQLKDDLQKHVNSQVGKMSKLQHIYVKTTPFVKTPTKKQNAFYTKILKNNYLSVKENSQKQTYQYCSKHVI